MLPAPFQNALILTGPTGAGKTELSLELAERLGAEIVAMDSMTIYRGMDVGTAKPSEAERRRVPHHLIDVLEPSECASVAWWLERAADCCRQIEARGKRVLFVGGTPLYLKALLRGLFDGPSGDAELRRRLTEEADQLGRQALHDRLAQVDPRSAGRLHPNDLRRVIRALEVWELTGRPISAWQTQWLRKEDGGWRIEDRGSRVDEEGTGRPLATDDPRSSILDPPSSILLPPSSFLNHCLWLELPRDELYARIDARVRQMFAAGLVEEVRGLRARARPLSREATQALGYKEVFDYLDGRITREETITRVQIRTRHFAKRQLSWLRHLPECRPMPRELTFAAWGLTIRT